MAKICKSDNLHGCGKRQEHTAQCGKAVNKVLLEKYFVKSNFCAILLQES